MTIYAEEPRIYQCDKCKKEHETSLRARMCEAVCEGLQMRLV